MTQRDYARPDADDLRPDIATKAYASKFGGESDTPPSTCVVETVADALEADPTDVGPLYEAVDPDALDRLFEVPHRFTSGAVTFSFEGCNVTVNADGWVAVRSEQTTGSDS